MRFGGLVSKVYHTTKQTKTQTNVGQGLLQHQGGVATWASTLEHVHKLLETDPPVTVNIQPTKELF